MVLCVKTPVKQAQEVKRFLIENNLLDHEFMLKKEKDCIYFPIKKEAGIAKQFPSVEVARKALQLSTRKRETLKKAVEKSLSKEEMAILRRAFDTIGDIAILEIPQELESKERLIAKTLLKLHGNIRTVLKKAGIHGTEFRTQPMKWLAGAKTKETVHKEHGIRLKLNVETVYFSPRLSTERKRVAGQVKKGERVLVMFSGCAPYPCVISKTTSAKEIVGIEINPAGHDYGVENLELNRITNVTLINADVKDAVPLLDTKFDRIVMPLPKSAGDFLDIALSVSKKGTIINFYAFEEKGNFRVAHKRIREACRKAKKSCRIMRAVKCGQQSPGTYRICVDFKII